MKYIEMIILVFLLIHYNLNEILANNDISGIDPCFCSDYVDWLNEHHFDYRGLIEKGLALEAPEDMYKIK